MRGQVRVYQRKIVAKKRRKAFYYTFYSLCLGALVVSGLSYLSHLDNLEISEIAVKGNEALLQSDIEAVVERSLSGNYQGIFSKKNALIYPRRGIERSLLSMPIVKSAKVSQEGFGGLLVAIEERKMKAFWCEPSVETALCYKVDEDGFVFAPAFDVSPATAFIYRGLIAEDPIGKAFLPSESFRQIEFFLRELASLSVNPREATFAETGTMTVLLDGGGKIVVSAKDDLSATLGNISAVLSDRSVVADLDEFLANLDYMKFDAGNKVVYKMKGK